MISVIVPAKNEAAFIEECLRALRNQTLQDDEVEILVLDNGSTDSTFEIAQRFTPNVHHAPGLSISALRNLGARISRGQILAFTDADCVVSPTWVEGAKAALAEGGAAAGNKYDLPSKGHWIEEVWLGRVPEGRLEASELWSGNLVVTRSAFDACGGFDESLISSEDVVFSAALQSQAPLYFDDRVRVLHLGGPRTLWQFARQQLWHGAEEWTLFRRRISRSTFVPTMLCVAALLMLPASVFIPAIGGVSTLALGAGTIVFAAFVHLRAQLRGRAKQRLPAVLRLALLNMIGLPCRAAAVLTRAAGVPLAGRPKRRSPTRYDSTHQQAVR